MSFLVTLFCLVSFPCLSRADELRLIPSITVREEYNDNILYWTSEAQKDYITTITPRLNLLNKTERMEIDLSGHADRRLYSKYSELNATDQFYQGKGRYYLTERINVSGKAYYSKDSNPDRDLQTTGFAFTGVTRYRQNYGAGLDYALSEIAVGSFSYDYLTDTYNDPRYRDLEAHVFGMGAIQDLSYFMQKTQARMNIGYARYNIPDLRVDNYEWTTGINRALDEKWNLQIDGGVRYTTSRFAFVEVIITPPFYVNRYDNSQDWGGVGRLALTYRGPKSSAEVRANHDIMPASGQSGTSERTAFLASVNMQPIHELRWTLHGGYFINRSKAGQYSVEKIDENSIWISPSITYEYSKDVSLNLSYTYNKTQYNISKTEAERNIFQVNFKIQHDLFN